MGPRLTPRMPANSSSPSFDPGEYVPCKMNRRISSRTTLGSDFDWSTCNCDAAMDM
jgi:hypothetical protein